MPEVKLVPLTQFETVNTSIKPARSTVADWYKDSPRRAEGYKTYLTQEGISSSTYKQCAPFLDGMTLGYMAVLTCDIEVSTGENDLPLINHKAVARQILTLHSNDQWEGMACPPFHYPTVLKWHQDLFIKTPKNYSLLFTHPMNRLDLPFTTISGVVDTDSYRSPTHFPFWLKQGFTGVIEAGTPVCQIIPILREKWTRSPQDFNLSEALTNEDNYSSRIVKAYKTFFWQKKTYE